MHIEKYLGQWFDGTFAWYESKDGCVDKREYTCNADQYDRYILLLWLWLVGLSHTSFVILCSSILMDKNGITFMFLLFQRFEYALDTPFTAKLIAASIISTGWQTLGMLCTICREKFELRRVWTFVEVSFWFWFQRCYSFQ